MCLFRSAIHLMTMAFWASSQSRIEIAQTGITTLRKQNQFYSEASEQRSFTYYGRIRIENKIEERKIRICYRHWKKMRANSRRLPLFLWLERVAIFCRIYIFEDKILDSAPPAFMLFSLTILRILLFRISLWYHPLALRMLIFILVLTYISVF